MDIPLTVHADAATPIYLQIKYQLRYLITSGKLPEGRRLPTVRAAAERLHVNPGTVSQAYKELHEQGLIEAAPGRGTFVASTLPVDGDALVRQRLLDDALETALQRARALGFREAEIRQHVETLLTTTREAVPVLLVAPTTAIARKYATSLERRLGPTLAVRPVTFAEVARRAPHVAVLLDGAYFVITFAGFARQVEDDLKAFATPARVLGVKTEVQPATLEALGEVGPDETICLVTQEPYLPPTLALIEERTGRAADAVAICLDGDAARAREVLPTVDRAIYTFAARDFVIEMGVPPERRLEVMFDLTPASVARLRRVLLPDEADGARTDDTGAGAAGAEGTGTDHPDAAAPVPTGADRGGTEEHADRPPRRLTPK